MRSGFTHQVIPTVLYARRPETPEQEAALAAQVEQITADHGGTAPSIKYIGE